MRRLVLCLIALLMTGHALAQSNRNQWRVPQPNADITQQDRANELRGTDQSPLSVKVMPTPKTDAERDEEAKERREKAETDRKLADYTGELALFTKGLFYATVVLGIGTIGLACFGFLQFRAMKASIAAAQTAADAAMLSARAAIGIELPIFRISPDSVISQELRDGDKISVSYTVSRVILDNLGRTEAFPIEIKYGMTCGENLPSEPHYSGVDNFIPNYIIEPDPSVTPQKRLSGCSVIIQPNDGERVSEGTLGLWFYCSLLYDDFMETRRETAFCWKWTQVGGEQMVWRPDSTPAYNKKSSGSPS